MPGDVDEAVTMRACWQVRSPGMSLLACCVIALTVDST
jgi:hypothetical protein